MTQDKPQFIEDKGGGWPCCVCGSESTKRKPHHAIGAVVIVPAVSLGGAPGQGYYCYECAGFDPATGRFKGVGK
jgi:hypothetical protein